MRNIRKAHDTQESMESHGFRYEKDLLGKHLVPENSLFGVHTVRAVKNFNISGRRVPASLIHAFGDVKLASARTCHKLGVWKDQAKAKAIFAACTEMSRGLLDQHIVVDAFQGGAGTSTNMNVNEVLANRALQILGRPLGDYDYIAPLDDINRYQSTNDAYPTAMKLALIWQLKDLEKSLKLLVASFRNKERQFANIVKIGRTQLQDAVPITLGKEMGAYAAALTRDYLRIRRCSRHLLTVNLGGTAIGTGVAATREYITMAVKELKSITGLKFTRADDMVDNTQNADVFVEVSGVLKTCASSLLKIATDLRILSSGPEGGIKEIFLPPMQAGSSIMPGKVNPVIPEAVTQTALHIIGCDAGITIAAGMGNLELNPFLPFTADALLNGSEMLAKALDTFRVRCIDGLMANEPQCRANVESSTALVTALVPIIGYSRSVELVKIAKEKSKTVREVILEKKVLTNKQVNRLLSPKVIMMLGTPPVVKKGAKSKKKR